MLKKLSFIMILLLGTMALFSCEKKTTDYSEYKVEAPESIQQSGDYNIDFVNVHNFVIDYMTDEQMPFFYVKDGKFDISGDNEKKEITITCECITGTTEEDIDLFLSMALNGIGIDASEQDYRLKAPSVDADGAYQDFGSVFNYYDLKVNCTLEGGQVLKNFEVKAGKKIPIEPRYILE